MIRQNSLKLLTLLSLTALPLGTVGCSNGSSPTEPAALDAPVLSASTGAVSSVSEESKGRGKGRGKGRRGGRNGGGQDDNQGGGGRNRGQDGGQDNHRRTGQEFEGSVASVGQNSVTLANGTRIIVNGQTQWIARGDLHSLSEVSRAVDADRPTRVEGRGTRQGNGNFVAATIKAEVDD